MIRFSAPFAALLLTGLAGCGEDHDQGGGLGGDPAPIAVKSPKPGASVSSPVAVTGTASVFEGTLQLRVLDADGRQIGRTFTTASAGAPARGGFSKAVTFTVARPQDGVVKVFEANAASPGEGGKGNLFTVRVPVQLEP